MLLMFTAAPVLWEGDSGLKFRDLVVEFSRWVRGPWVQLSRDQEPDPSEGLEGHHLALAASAGDQCSFWPVVGGRQDQPSGSCL